MKKRTFFVSIEETLEAIKRRHKGEMMQKIADDYSVGRSLRMEKKTIRYTK